MKPEISDLQIKALYFKDTAVLRSQQAGIEAHLMIWEGISKKNYLFCTLNQTEKMIVTDAERRYEEN